MNYIVNVYKTIIGSSDKYWNVESIDQIQSTWNLYRFLKIKNVELRVPQWKSYSIKHNISREQEKKSISIVLKSRSNLLSSVPVKDPVFSVSSVKDTEKTVSKLN